MYDICDIHGHFLPGMDDGCKSVEESLQVLQRSYDGGIRKMLATPHYYATESIDSFLSRREASEQALRSCIPENLRIPSFCCGAEVAYYPSISREKDLHKLCIGSSRYLLLELPFSRWSSDMARDLYNLSIQGYIPVIAHIERYIFCQSRNALQDILDLDLPIQMNAEFLLNRWHRWEALRLLKGDLVQFLGSDCHDPINRPPNLGDGLAFLERKGHTQILEQLQTSSDEIFP